MFSKTNLPTASNKKTPPSLIAADVNLLGNIISDGVIDVDGRIEGDVKCVSVTVRANGKVKGDIIADLLHVFGEVKGVIRAKKVFLHSGCRVVGIVMHESLTMEDGAYLDGRCKRTDKMLVEEDMRFQEEDEESPPSHGNAGGSSGEGKEDGKIAVLDHVRLISQ